MTCHDCGRTFPEEVQMRRYDRTEPPALANRTTKVGGLAVAPFVPHVDGDDVGVLYYEHRPPPDADGIPEVIIDLVCKTCAMRRMSVVDLLGGLEDTL